MCGVRVRGPLPPIEYAGEDRVLKVRSQGSTVVHGQALFIGSGLAGRLIALGPTADNGVLRYETTAATSASCQTPMRRYFS